MLKPIASWMAALCLWSLVTLVQADEVLLIRALPGKTLEEATVDLKRAISSHNYTFVRQQAIDNRLVPSDWEAASVRIVYFCNFAMMDAALRMDVRAAQFLPCRVTLIERQGGVDLVAINPVWVSASWGNAEMERACRHLRNDFLAIFEEAAL